MKQRKGFVSNSSSSSFIVIAEGALTPYKQEHGSDEFIVSGDIGETEFGWQEETYYDTGSKIIFAYFQAMGDQTLIAMLEKVLKEHSGFDIITWNITDSYEEEERGGKDWGYVDHQSLGQGNAEMYENEHRLKQFLFCDESYINNDNDNH